MRKLILVGVVAAIGVGISIGVVFGSDSSNTIIRATATRDARSLPVHQVSANQAKLATKARRGFKYFETNAFTLEAAGTAGDSGGISGGKCPRHWKAISGYFGSDNGDVVPAEDFVGGLQPVPRKWTIIVRNEDAASTQAFVGFVCARV
jgi:hypothetical protein